MGAFIGLSSRRRLRRFRTLRLVAGAMLAAGLATGTMATTASRASGVVHAARARAGLRTINQRDLQAIVQKTARDLHVPGALVLLRTPQGQFVAAYGTTQLGFRIRPQPYTRFRIASITKTMTSAMILQLAQEKKLQLSDPVSKYVAGVPNGDHITIELLLKMRTGLFDYTSAPEMAPLFDSQPSKVWTPQELLAISFKHPPNFAPGTNYEYSNTNYALLGLIVEKLDRRPLAASMQVRLFNPLGLKNTLLPPSNSNVIPAPFSHGYLYGSASAVTTGIPNPPYTPAFQAAVRAGKVRPRDFTSVNHSFAEAAGGVISTSNDLAMWIQALVGGRMLDGQYQRLWLASPIPSGHGGLDYGYGINRLRWAGNSLYLHGGETVGYNSEAAYDPTNKLTLVVWSNLTISPFDGLTANKLMLNVLDRVYTVSPLAPGALARPAG